MGEWKPIDDLFDYEKGSLQSSKCTPGKYSFITAAEEWKTHEKFTHDGEALIFAMAASGSLGRTHYVNGKFISSDLCFILTPNKGLRLDLIFYYRLFNFLRADIVKKTATGTSKLAINQTNFGAYKLPYFDYDHQVIFRKKIETIAGINEEFSNGMNHQLSLLAQLRQAVLQEGIEGKLTAEWRKHNPELISGDNHASKLLEKIKAEKERLFKEGKIKRDKPLAPIADDEKPFELPDGWVWCRLGELLRISSGDGLTSKEMAKGGDFPVFGGNGINGYHDKCNISEKTIVIGRVGAQCGSVHVTPEKAWVTDNAFITYYHEHYLSGNWLEKLLVALNLRDRARETAQPVISGKRVYPVVTALPSFAEQQATVKRIGELTAMIDELEKQVTERKVQAEMLIHSVLREAFAGEV